MALRYEIGILRSYRDRRFRKPKPRKLFRFAESDDLQGAFVLLAEAPFYADLDEVCFIEDTTTREWVGVKHGRVPA